MSRAQHHINETPPNAEYADDTISEEEILQELSVLVDQGYLCMGVSEEGKSVFWPTSRGIKELGMEGSLDPIPS